MKFNSTRNVNSNSYIRAGSVSGRQSAELFNAIKEASPDYFGIVKTKQDADSAKARQALQSTGDVGQRIIEARAIREKAKYRDDLQYAKTKQGDQQRFAGLLGALGSDLINDYIEYKRPKKEEPPSRQPYKSDTSIIDRLEGRIEELENDLQEVPKPDAPRWGDFAPEGVTLPNTVQDTQTEGASAVSTPGTPGTPGTIPTQSQLLPAMSPAAVRSTFIRAGASPSVADRFAYQIVPAESGGIPNNNTITSGLVNRAGETSYGIAQINMYDTQDPVEKARRLKLFGIERSTDLFDPDVNARAALKILDEQGWGAWSTYDPSVVY